MSFYPLMYLKLSNLNQIESCFQIGNTYLKVIKTEAKNVF